MTPPAHRQLQRVIRIIVEEYGAGLAYQEIIGVLALEIGAVMGAERAPAWPTSAIRQMVLHNIELGAARAAASPGEGRTLP